jgi:TRAP-type C4-dicarboxylate transport system permease small subunit
LLSVTETLAGLFLLAIALLIAVNVFLRDVLSIQIPDWFDGSKLLQGIALMWGFAVATYYGSHICVDIVWEHLQENGRRALDVLSTVITMLFLGTTAWMVGAKVMSTGSQTTSDLQLPVVYFYAVAAMGVVAASVLAALRVARLVTRTPIDVPDQEDGYGS